MTKHDYEQNLKWLLEKKPNDPLLPLMRDGYSRINVVYMRHAIKGLVVKEEQPAEAASPETIDPVLRELWAEKGRLFRYRAKLSNRFHECKTDMDRKQVNEEILQVWQKILGIDAKIRTYEQHGVLPDEADEFALPDNPAELVRKLFSIRTMISAEQSKLRALANLPDEDPDKAKKIKSAETRLANLKLQRGYAETKAKGLQ